MCTTVCKTGGTHLANIHLDNLHRNCRIRIQGNHKLTHHIQSRVKCRPCTKAKTNLQVKTGINRKTKKAHGGTENAGKKKGHTELGHQPSGSGKNTGRPEKKNSARFMPTCIDGFF